MKGGLFVELSQYRARVVSICHVMSQDFNSEYVSLFNHRGIGLDIVEVLHCSTFTVTLTAESTCVLKCDSIISEITGLHTGKKDIMAPKATDPVIPKVNALLFFKCSFCGHTTEKMLI